MNVSLRNRYLNPLLLALYLACGMIITIDSPHAAEASYVAGFESLPLMPGLREQENERVNFDTAAGRIVEAKTRGQVEAQAVEDFYLKTLPQLGWQKTGSFSFEREGERLSIEIPSARAQDGNLIVRFSIRPITTP